MGDLDLEGHAFLALDAVSGAGEVVVWTLLSQRYLDGQRLAEVLASAAVLEGVVGVGIVVGAALVCRFVIGLDHCLVRVGLENWELKENEALYACLDGEKMKEK